MWAYYRTHGRDLAWRRTRDPYRILVSEIMLQQTQVARVEGYYERFMKQFPNFASLARVSAADVLRAWQGLGYNRRALALRAAAKIVVEKYGGKLPRDREALESLPGVGPYTAGAVRVFAFGEPDVFVETNIRRVFIHFFFPRAKNVRDEKLLAYIRRPSGLSKNRKRLSETEAQRLRKWYYALMDYGAMLGVTEKENPNRRSAHYARQSKFSGSDRELRGKIVRLVLSAKKIPVEKVVSAIPEPKKRILAIVSGLEREGFLKKEKSYIKIS